MFDTKFAIVLRDDLASWQALNVTAFLASGIVAQDPEIIGEAYRDKAGNVYNAMSIQPAIVLAADAATMGAIHRRTLERGVRTSAYVERCSRPAMTPPTAPSSPNSAPTTPRSSASRYAPRRRSSTRSSRARACIPERPAPSRRRRPFAGPRGTAS